MSTGTPVALPRRRLTQALIAAPMLSIAPWARASSSVKIAQSVALTGALGELGLAIHTGAKVAFDSINARGGVQGRKIELEAIDDGYDVKRAVANVDKFLADSSTFALFNCMGTPMNEAILPKIKETGIPYFAPFTGALSARPKDMRNVFNIRASYPDEAEQLIQHLATVGIKRIGIIYQNNSFGKEVFEGAKTAMTKHKLTDAVVATVEGNASDAVAAAAKITSQELGAVLIGAAGKPAVETIKAIRAKQRGLPIYALSILGSAATIKSLGEDAQGIAISQVVPLPYSISVPIVRDFLVDWKNAKLTLDPSHLAFEGYINARAFAEALRRPGALASRNAFIESTWKMRNVDMGGFALNFTEPGKNASRFVELTMVARNGRFVR